jgi:hypothetical protein
MQAQKGAETSRKELKSEMNNELRTSANLANQPRSANLHFPIRPDRYLGKDGAPIADGVFPGSKEFLAGSRSSMSGLPNRSVRSVPGFEWCPDLAEPRQPRRLQCGRSGARRLPEIM